MVFGHDEANPAAAAQSTDTLPIKVRRFTRGTGTEPNYLVVDLCTESADTHQQETATASGSHPSPGDQAAASERRDTPSGGPTDNEDDDLATRADLTGSGESVTVEAWVTHTIALDTDDPIQKGLLGDDSVKDGVPFVIYREADVDRRSKGEKYRFVNARDHLYERDTEIQLLVGTHTAVYQLTS